MRAEWAFPNEKRRLAAPSKSRGRGGGVGVLLNLYPSW
jgi:hypothetical protein